MSGFEKQPGLKWLKDNAGHRGDDCLLWPFCLNSAGYGTFAAGKRMRYAHRVMCELVHGKPPKAHQAAHACGNTCCVNPSHLSWKTARENQLDRHKHGTFNGRRLKLTAEDAAAIRQLKGAELASVTAERFGVTEANIRQIQSGQIWGVDRIRYREFTEIEVAAIRMSNLPAPKVAAVYGVHPNAIRRIRNGVTYRYFQHSSAMRESK